MVMNPSATVKDFVAALIKLKQLKLEIEPKKWAAITAKIDELIQDLNDRGQDTRLGLFGVHAFATVNVILSVVAGYLNGWTPELEKVRDEMKGLL